MSTEPARDDGSDSNMSQIFATKSALRKSMLKALRQIPESELQKQSDAVFSQLSKLDAYKDAKSVGCYLSMAKGELQTVEIIKDLLDRGVTPYTPYLPSPSQPISLPAETISRQASDIPSTSDMQMLRLYSLADLAACPLDKWGILDPGETRRDTGEWRENALIPSASDLDLILIPGVAFDLECNRLGRGKGFYDRYLARYGQSRKSPTLLALALSPQMLEEGGIVPTTGTDYRLDGVIAPNGVTWQKKG